MMSMESKVVRDHREIGKEQELWMFDKWSPGSAYFLPAGTRLVNRILDFLRTEYRVRGYDELITPQLFDRAIWKQSGHWDHYAPHMYTVSGTASHSSLEHVQSNELMQHQHLKSADVLLSGKPTGTDDFDGERKNVNHDDANDDERKRTMELKPMNCPAHCVVYSSRLRSYRELPLRFADFGMLHRNELSGALGGLTRVRRFQQDDAHIFCDTDQVEEEIEGCLEFLEHAYSVMGFDFELRLSTRPAKYMGDESVWDGAEAALGAALDRFGKIWSRNVGDGAFYGPKIDIVVKDALGREHQLATVQLDFQLPERFDLRFLDAEGQAQRPVIIHRAILGSLERMIAILAEHTDGRWPFWLNPRQAAIVTVNDAAKPFANQVRSALTRRYHYADVFDSADTVSKKVRAAQVAQYSYILVVGDREVADGTVSVRTRDNQVRGNWKLDQLYQHFAEQQSNYQ
jgi:threonyl-tRNA synthetase